MQSPDLVTSFQFRCTHCSEANEYVHEHGRHVRPFLVSTRCVKCLKLNRFDGLAGTVVTTRVRQSTGGEGQVDLVPIDTHFDS